LTKNGLGYILGYLFTHLNGHPGQNPDLRACTFQDKAGQVGVGLEVNLLRTRHNQGSIPAKVREGDAGAAILELFLSEIWRLLHIVPDCHHLFSIIRT
jgi:hypothetical protein